MSDQLKEEKGTGFPGHLKEMAIGIKFGCPTCEYRFTIEERNPQTGKKSKSWILGHMTWGTQTPRYCEVLICKCPACGQPVQAIILTQPRDAAELLKVEANRKPEAPAKPEERRKLPPPPNKILPLTAPPRFVAAKEAPPGRPAPSYKRDKSGLDDGNL